MKNILKYAKANVCISDKETKKILFEGSNLFVDSGRAFIANIFFDPYPFDKAKMACDLGNSSATPLTTDVDLGGEAPPSSTYITDCSVALVGGTATPLLGESTGVLFQFSYTNSSGSSKVVREIGLFYRPISDNFPLRGSAYPGDLTMVGTMLARLKTTLSSITVSNGKSLTIDWKIIF